MSPVNPTDHPTPRPPLPTHLSTLFQPLTQMGTPAQPQAISVKRPSRLPTDHPYSLLPQTQFSGSPLVLQKNTSHSFPSLLCTSPVDSSGHTLMTSLPFLPSIPPSHSPSKHALVNNQQTGQESKKHSANVLSENPKRKYKPKKKTPIQQPQTQKAAPRPITTQNPDAQMPALKTQ